MKVRFTLLLGALVVFLLAALLVGTFFLSQGGCSLGMFTCSQGSVCVPQRAVCNGHEDCPGGEDESATTCGNFHGSGFILDLMKNSKFNQSVHDCEHEGLPEGCFCRRQLWVYCKQLNLTSVPAHVRGNFTRLILANNSISDLPEDAFDSYLLELIHLEGNGIKVLPPKIFHRQRKIKKLLVMRNKLEAIDDHLFEGLENLSMLYLQQNRISYLSENAFRDLIALRYLYSLDQVFINSKNTLLEAKDDLSANRLILKDGFPFVPSVYELLLDSNQITQLKENHFQNVSSVNYLGLKENQINIINSRSFFDLTNLTELDLSHNQLTMLPKDVFQPNPHLKNLFLGFNPMLTVNNDMFRGLSALASLYLEDIEINEIDTETFAALNNLDFIYFKKYYYCTFVPNIPKCNPKTDGLSTFQDLLGRKSLCAIVWFVSSATFIGNTFVIWRRRATRDENRSLSLLVRNLAVSDFLMGMYLTIIGWKDVEYRGIYHMESRNWMASWTCSLAGALAMISSEVSIMILVFISVERFLLIALPFSGHKTLSVKSTYRFLAVIWICGGVLAVCPMLLYYKSTRFYGANGMCFPLHLDDPFFVGWQVSAFVFILFNSLGMVTLAVLYTGMLISVLRTRNATSTVNSSDFEFAVRFFFIVLTNTASWLPIVILKILAVYRIYLSASVYAWIAVVIIPVNSAFNPFLYTVTTPRYREMIVKAVLRSVRTFRRTNNKRVASIDTSSINAANQRVRLSTLDTNATSFDETSQGKNYRLSLDENISKEPDCLNELAEIRVGCEEPPKDNFTHNDVYM